jgi:alpha-glucosidase
LLVAPPGFGETLDDYSVSYPPGDWYDFWTGQKMPPSPTPPGIVQIAMAAAEGKKESDFPHPPKIHPQLDTLPVYVRGGSILPMQPVTQSTEEIPQGPLELRVYPGDNCRGSLYLDDGHTFRYQHGEFLRQEFHCTVDRSTIRINFDARQGSYQPWWKNIELVIYNWPSAKPNIKLSNHTTPLKQSYDAVHHELHILVPDVSTAAELTVESAP